MSRVPVGIAFDVPLGAPLTVVLHGSMLDRQEDGGFAWRSTALARCGALLAGPMPGAWGAPTPPWTEGPKSGDGARRATFPRLTQASDER